MIMDRPAKTGFLRKPKEVKTGLLEQESHYLTIRTAMTGGTGRT
jgi:hypothetical protein